MHELGIESSKCIHYGEFDFAYERSVSLGILLNYLKRFVLEMKRIILNSHLFRIISFETSRNVLPTLLTC